MGTKTRVLVVEDSPAAVARIREFFSASKGRDFELSIVLSLEEAKECLAHEPIDAIILDLGLPDSEGLDSVSGLRGPAGTLPIIVLTGTHDESLGPLAIQEGAQDYLTKDHLTGDRLVRTLVYALERTRHREALQYLIATIPDGIVVAEEGGAILLANPAAEALFGLSTAELAETPPDLPLDEAGPTELRLGPTCAVEVRTAPFVWDGRPARLAVIRDVSSRKRYEERYRQSQKMEAVGKLAGGISHEFNNLLTVIRGFADLAQKETEDDELRYKLNKIIAASDRGAKLTRQLMTYSTRELIQPEVVDLNELLWNLSLLLDPIVGERIKVVLNLFPGAGRVYVDPSQFPELLFNLAANARDAMPGGGELVIETARVQLQEKDVQGEPALSPGPFVMVAVGDTGKGMDEKTRSRAFEPFFTTKDVNEGTGLGLAMVQGAVRHCGGKVAIESDEGRGTTVKIWLPAVVAKELGERTVSVVPADASPASAAGGETILVAEDEEDVLTLLRLVLESAGYEVIAAPSGEAAIEAFEAHEGPLDMLLTDVIMPGINGRQLAERLRESLPDLPVLYVSGYTENIIGEEGVIEKGLHLLQKPFLPAKLEARVRSILDGA